MKNEVVWIELKELFKTVLNEDVEKNSKQSDIEGWDSLGHLRLIMNIEQAFGISFETSEISEIDSVNAILKTILSRQ